VPLWRLPATTLSSMLGRGEVSASEVLRAHIERVDALDPRLHAFTEILRERARADAEASDARRRKGQSRGPLDGVPVSVKECFDIAGRATTLGIAAWRGRIAGCDAAMVDLLRDAGAVVFGRTNLSQTMLFIEARNPLFGQTVNPWSADHTPGGSSGGEGAAIASGMSPLGIGTDIGGSIRTPCHFSGICGIKPSLDRLPMKGYRSVLVGQEAVRGMGGPMARTVGDLALFFRALDPRKMHALDSRVPPLAWEEPESVKLEGLCVGTYVDDGVIPVSRAIARAARRAAQVLRDRGCVTREFHPPDVRAMMSPYLGALTADDGAAVLGAIAGGPIDPVLEPIRRLASVPLGARHLIARAARALGHRNFALMLDAIGPKTAAELWHLTAQLRDYRAALLDSMDRLGIDVLLCPPLATPALPHGASKNFALASSYSMIFNATQMPAGIVPVTRVGEGETAREASRDSIERRAARVDARSVGLPVGVQVAARPWKDHVAIAVMAAIEAGVAGDAGFPATPVE
jgi:fatty acid amide hydrolase